jgi:hypothetical protein
MPLDDRFPADLGKGAFVSMFGSGIPLAGRDGVVLFDML